ncbi:hypothetical protein D3C87_791770 [compost metagenome]
MDRDHLKESLTPQEDTIAERFRPVPSAEEESIEETEALKRSPAPQEIFHPREPGPHPRP